MSPRARRFFGCYLPLLLLVGGCASLGLIVYGSQIAFQMVPVRDTAMMPVLEPGWRVLVNNTAFWARDPEPGSIVSLGGPAGQAFRRLYGMPGQTIEARRGVLYIEGEPSRIRDRAHGQLQDFGPLTLGPDEYFVLAEDRAAEDSRSWGPLVREQLYGTALFYMPRGSSALYPVDPTPTPQGRRPGLSPPTPDAGRRGAGKPEHDPRTI